MSACRYNEFWSRCHRIVLLWLHMLLPASSGFLWPFCCHSPPSLYLLLSSAPFSRLSLPSTCCYSCALKPCRDILRQEPKDTSQIGRMEAIFMRIVITQILHLWCCMLGFTSRFGELCFCNYRNESRSAALQWGEGVGEILTIFVNFPPLDSKMRRNKIGCRIGYFPCVVRLLITVQSQRKSLCTGSSVKLRLASSWSEDIPTVFPELFPNGPIYACAHPLICYIGEGNWTKHMQGLVDG